MIEITSAAQEKLLEIVNSREEEIVGLRVAIRGRGPAGFDHSMQFVLAGEEPEDAVITEDGDLRVFVDQDQADSLQGSKINFIPATGNFDIDNPNPPFVWDDPLSQRVQEVLTQQINPGVAQHGGWVSLLEVKDDVAYIELGGGCVGCGLVDVTLKQGVEIAIKASVPEIASVVDRTDHASGMNPYFQPSKNDPTHQPSKGGQAPPASPFS
ncbi:MAG: NifU family protein [Anaerolineales bacterium]